MYQHFVKIAELLENIGTADALVAANAVEMAVMDEQISPDIKRVAARLVAFANALDADGRRGVSNHIDQVLFAWAADDERDKNPRNVLTTGDPSYEEKYDFKKEHNNMNLYQGYHPKKVEVGEPAYLGLKGFNGAPALLTRHSPEIPGVHLLRVSDGVYQDTLTKKIYDFNTGWVGEDGKKYPGGSVAAQTPSAPDWTGSFPRVFESSPTQRPR